MIKVVIYEKDDRRVGIKCQGHAGYSEAGSDIVCAAVSVLVQNTINSIETLTSAEFQGKVDEKKAIIEFVLTSYPDEKTELLFSSLILGLESVRADVEGEYISIKFEEV